MPQKGGKRGARKARREFKLIRREVATMTSGGDDSHSLLALLLSPLSLVYSLFKGPFENFFRGTIEGSLEIFVKVLG